MNNVELIKVNENEEGQATVSGRELHELLEITTPYAKWFNRMCDYGFEEKQDYIVTDIFVPNSKGGKQTQVDHIMSIDMAKEIAMLQRSEKGKMARQYFIELEKKWNDPDAIIERSMRILKQRVDKLYTTNLMLEQKVTEYEPKATYHDLVLQSPTLISITQIAKDYDMSAKAMNKLLHELEVQYKQSGTWFLYAKHQGFGYTQSKTYKCEDNSTRMNTYWTQSGRLFLYETLKSAGVLPVIEKENDENK